MQFSDLLKLPFIFLKQFFCGAPQLFASVYHDRNILYYKEYAHVCDKYERVYSCGSEDSKGNDDGDKQKKGVYECLVYLLGHGKAHHAFGFVLVIYVNVIFILQLLHPKPIILAAYELSGIHELDKTGAEPILGMTKTVGLLQSFIGLVRMTSDELLGIHKSLFLDSSRFKSWHDRNLYRHFLRSSLNLVSFLKKSAAIW